MESFGIKSRLGKACLVRSICYVVRLELVLFRTSCSDKLWTSILLLSCFVIQSHGRQSQFTLCPAHVLDIHSCLFSEEGELLAFLARR